MISRLLGTSRQHNGGPDQRVYAKCVVCHSSLLRITNYFHPNVAFPKSRPLCLLFFVFFFILSRELWRGRVCEIAQMASKGTSKSFKGCTLFRHRIVTATLSGKPIRISDIRSNTVSHASCIRSINTAYNISMFFQYYSTRNTPAPEILLRTLRFLHLHFLHILFVIDNMGVCAFRMRQDYVTLKRHSCACWTKSQTDAK